MKACYFYLFYYQFKQEDTTRVDAADQRISRSADAKKRMNAIEIDRYLSNKCKVRQALDLYLDLDQWFNITCTLMH